MFITKSHYVTVTQSLSQAQADNIKLEGELKSLKGVTSNLADEVERLRAALARAESAGVSLRKDNTRLEKRAEHLNGQLLALECSLPDIEWAARLGYQMLRNNSEPDSLAGRVATEIQRRLKGKTQFVGVELSNPLVLEAYHGA